MAGEEPSGCNCKCFMIWFVRFIKVFTVISLLATIAAYCVIINYGIKTEVYNNIDKAFCVLGNSGFIVICLFLIIAEFEPAWFIKRVAIMHYWVARGFWIIWMGIQCISTAKQLGATINGDKDSEVDGDFVKVFGTVIGSIMIGCGLIFCLLTAFCVRSLTEPDDLASPLTDGNATDDAILAANMAIALGMTPMEAKKRFSKDKGVKEAQTFAKQRADQMAQLEKAMKDTKGMAAASQKYAQDAVHGYAAAASAAAPPPQQTAKYQPSDAYSDPSTGGGKPGAHDDEDELMKAYYGR